jgi:pimeloyl-ACP methyl ester carboxylesterase
MTSSLTSVATPDGRTLGVAEWGDPDGVPVFVLHGMPGSRLRRPPDEPAIRALGLRLITYDRPGYGRSTRHAGRRVVDCADDVRVIAHDLGIDRFRVSGASAGGPHALAVAARLSERVVAVQCVVSLAPFGVPGLDFLAGMDPANAREFAWAVEGEQKLEEELSRQAADMLGLVGGGPSEPTGDLYDLDEADRDVLGASGMREMFIETIREAFRNGVGGWVDDDLAMVAPWGFDLDEITVPLTIHYGERDVLVPAAHGAWLAGRLPQAHVVVAADGGHLTSADAELRQLEELATST